MVVSYAQVAVELPKEPAQLGVGSLSEAVLELVAFLCKEEDGRVVLRLESLF